MRVAHSDLRGTRINYPGKIAFEIFTAGCNWKCPSCHSRDAVLCDETYSSCGLLDEIKKYQRINPGWVDGLAICGGEPTIQTDLVDFISKVKKETKLKVKLDTNGTNPSVLDDLRKRGIVDYVAMDIKGSRDLYPKLISREIGRELDFRELEKSIALVSQFPDYEFRTTILERFHTPEKVDEMGKWISSVLNGKAKRFYFQRFRNSGNLLDPNFKEADTSITFVEGLVPIMQNYAEEVKAR